MKTIMVGLVLFMASCNQTPTFVAVPAEVPWPAEVLLQDVQPEPCILDKRDVIPVTVLKNENKCLRLQNQILVSRFKTLRQSVIEGRNAYEEFRLKRVARAAAAP